MISYTQKEHGWAKVVIKKISWLVWLVGQIRLVRIFGRKRKKS